jgi:ribose/xylose/arabinose/galactoside ABC-type transport system permease subunit
MTPHEASQDIVVRSGAWPAAERTVKQVLLRYGIVIALLGIGAVLSIVSPHFLKARNFMNVLQQATTVGIVALGMTFALTAGGVDLSVGSIVGLCGIIIADVLVSGYGMVLAIPVGLALGALCGCINGFLITRANMPSFVATLSTMITLRGITMLYTGGISIYPVKPEDSMVIAGQVAGIPKPILIAGLAAVVAHFLHKHSKLGHYATAIGGNEEAAFLSGIPVHKYKVMIWALSGLMAGLSALILTARLYAAEPMSGQGYELDAIAATVIGGTSFSGGDGTVFGTVIGTLLISMLRNGLNLLNVNPYYHTIVVGTVIVIAVGLDKIRRNR